jgi:hypothetical protein
MSAAALRDDFEPEPERRRARQKGVLGENEARRGRCGSPLSAGAAMKGTDEAKEMNEARSCRPERKS